MDSFIQAVNTRSSDAFPLEIPLGLQVESDIYLEKATMEEIKKHILKRIHKFIHAYPGKYCSKQISTILELDFDDSDKHSGYTAMRATNELMKKGYIRKTSADGFIAIKPFA